MTRRLMLAALTLVAALPLRAMAHEGHDHKVLGTVTMAAADHVMLKDKDNKDVTVYLTRETKVLKDKKPMKVEVSNVVVAATAGSAQLQFTQLWQSGTYKDTGPKRMVLAREGAGLLIAREEMLALVSQRVRAGLDTAVELRQGEGALPELAAVARSLSLSASGLASAISRMRIFIFSAARFASFTISPEASGE